MSPKKRKFEVYFVRWDDEIVKIGATQKARYRAFVARGATIMALVERHCGVCMYHSEEAAQIMAATHPDVRRAFKDSSEAVDRLGSRGGGYVECFTGVADFILEAAVEAAQRYECRRVDRVARYQRLNQSSICGA